VHACEELEDFLHARAFADQAAVEGDFLHQALIFLPRATAGGAHFPAPRRRCSDSGYQLHVILVEAVGDVTVSR